MKTYLNVIKYRKILEQSDILEGSCNTRPVDVGGLLARDILSIKNNGTVRRLIYTC